MLAIVATLFWFAGRRRLAIFVAMAEGLTSLRVELQLARSGVPARTTPASPACAFSAAWESASEAFPGFLNWRTDGAAEKQYIALLETGSRSLQGI